jgi:hypothetical protein
MASDRDLELLDDYISNRLHGQEREAFEDKLNQDPDLKAEYNVQARIAESLRKARAVELKNLLNNIPTSAIPVDGSSNLLRYSAGAVIVAAIAIAIYFGSSQNDESQKVSSPEITADTAIKKEEPIQAEQITPSDEPVVPAEEAAPKTSESKKSVSPLKDTQTSTSTNKETSPTPSTVDVYDPSNENDGSTAEVPSAVNETPVVRAEPSKMPVEVDDSNRKYNFHYRLTDGKLVLYGAFDKDLYEILEFITEEKHTVFLFYKNNYYLLDESNKNIKALTPVTDRVLLQKLKEYRSH